MNDKRWTTKPAPMTWGHSYLYDPFGQEICRLPSPPASLIADVLNYAMTVPKRPGYTVERRKSSDCADAKTMFAVIDPYGEKVWESTVKRAADDRAFHYNSAHDNAISAIVFTGHAAQEYAGVSNA